MADKVGAGPGLKGSTQQCPTTVLIKHRRELGTSSPVGWGGAGTGEIVACHVLVFCQEQG